MIYLTLFLEFFKIGLFTFGGGYAMIPLIKQTVSGYGWLTEFEFLDFLGVCESTPGPIAVNMATYVGTTQGGFFGGLIATLGVILPSFIIILLVATVLKKVYNNAYFQSALNGITPVVTALIVCTGLILILNVIGFESIQKFNFDYISLITFAVLAVTYCIVQYGFKKKFNTILFIIISAIVGLLVSLIFI